MSRHFVLVNFAPILFGLFWLIYLIAWQRNNRESFETFVLERQVNFAADSAIEELLVRSPSVVSDTTDSRLSAAMADLTSNEVTVDPNIAVEEFSTTLAVELGLPDTYSSREYVQHNYIKALQVCVNNGFYTYTNLTYNSKGQADLISTPKIPYVGVVPALSEIPAAHTNPDDKFALFLSKSAIFRILWKDDGTINRVLESTTLGQYINDKISDQMSEEINTRVSEYMQKALVQAYGNNSAKTLRIPSAPSKIRGTMPVDGPTVLAVVDTSERNVGVEVIAFGVGGAQIVRNDPCVGYRHNEVGEWLWAKQSRLNEFFASLGNPGDAAFDELYDKLADTHPDPDPSHTMSGLMEMYLGRASERKYFDNPFEAAHFGCDEDWVVMEYK